MTYDPISGMKSGVVRLDAQPEAIAMDTARMAVLVIDMQNDFGAKGGMFDRAGIDVSLIQSVIGPTARVWPRRADAGVKVVYLKMGFARISLTWALPTLRIGCDTCASALERQSSLLMVRKAEF